VHPASAEAFTVVRGRIGLRVAGRETVAGPGDRTQVPAGQAHNLWNADDSEAYIIVEVQPGDRFMQMIRQLYGLARDGKATPEGMPRLLDGVAMGREFADTIRFTTPPRLVQRVIFRLLGPVARLTGHRGMSPQYVHTQPSYAAFEQLPTEITTRIPALAGVPHKRKPPS
jgi:hypothetical protein